MALLWYRGTVGKAARQVKENFNTRLPQSENVSIVIASDILKMWPGLSESINPSGDIRI